MQITVTKKTVQKLFDLNIFPRQELENAIRAYQEDKIGQFSAAIIIDNIAHECHF